MGYFLICFLKDTALLYHKSLFLFFSGAMLGHTESVLSNNYGSLPPLAPFSMANNSLPIQVNLKGTTEFLNGAKWGLLMTGVDSPAILISFFFLSLLYILWYSLAGSAPSCQPVVILFLHGPWQPDSAKL